MIWHLKKFRLRLWRLVRRHFLSVNELALCNDLTIVEAKMLFELAPQEKSK